MPIALSERLRPAARRRRLEFPAMSDDEAPAAPIAWRLTLSGAPQAHGPDTRVHALAPRDAALLAWLAAEGPTPRAQLAALLWPDVAPEAARNALRQRLFQLKRQLGAEIVAGTATLALAEGVRHDLADAEHLLGTQNLALGVEFDDWLARQREARRAQLRQQLGARCEQALAAGDGALAVALAQRLLALDPLSEEAHRRLIRTHYLAGDRAAALLAFDRCEQMLKHEIGTRPSAETLALLQTVESAATAPEPALLVPLRMPASLLRPPRMVGRDGELAHLLLGLRDGERVLVCGEAGLGKSRLLAEAAAVVAHEGGRTVVGTQARPGDAAVPYATLARLLRALADAAPAALARAPAGELGRLLPELGPAPSPMQDIDGLRLMRALRTLLDHAAGEIGALVLDDLHFIDGASAQLLQALLGEAFDGRTGPVALVLATRVRSQPQADALRHSFEADGLARRIDLVPLDEPALARLVQSLDLPGLDAQALAPQLLRHTGGNPLFALETLKHAWERGQIGGTAAPLLARPASVGQLIGQRLARLSPDALALARLAALAGPDFGIELAEALLHTPALRLADAWGELEAAQVLRGAQFAHDLVFEAVLAGVPQAIARHSHRSLAAWLEQHGGEPERIADHWQSAGEIGRSVEHLMEAGHRGMDRSFIAQARIHYERAVAAARESGQREAEFEALDSLQHNYEQDDPGDAHEAVIERMLALAATPLERLRARVDDIGLRQRRALPLDPGAIQADVDTALSLDAQTEAGTLARALITAHTRAGDADEAMAVYRRYESLLQQETDSFSRSVQFGALAAVLANQDRFFEADPLIVQSLALVDAIPDANEAMTLCVNRLRVLRTQGRSAALAWLEEIDRRHAVEQPNPRAWTQSRFVACETLRDAGRYGTAWATLGQNRERLPLHAGTLAPAWDTAEGSLWLDLGQHAKAGAPAQRLAQAAADPAMLGWLRGRALLVQAQVRARVAGQGLEDRPDAEAWALLDAAGACAPREARRNVWFEIVLQRAAWSDAATGAALAEGLASTAAAHGLWGYARRAWWLACERSVEAGQLSTARRCAAQGEALARRVFDPEVGPEPVLPTSGSELWIDGVRLQLAQATGAADAAVLAQAARERLQATLTQHVPDAWRDGFLHRHPVQIALQRCIAHLTPP